MDANDLHTCSYECQRPACIRAQRDDLIRQLAPCSMAAAYWGAFCDEADAGTFDVALLEDAKHMGAGVLELHYRDRLAAIDREGQG